MMDRDTLTGSFLNAKYHFLSHTCTEYRATHYALHFYNCHIHEPVFTYKYQSEAQMLPFPYLLLSSHYLFAVRPVFIQKKLADFGSVWCKSIIHHRTW